MSSANAGNTGDLVLIDDSDIFRRALIQFIELESGFHLLADAESLATALALPSIPAPDLVLLDWTLPDGKGGELIAPLLQRWPRAKIVVLTLDDSPVVRRITLSAGAHGLVSKTRLEDELLPLMRQMVAT